MKVSIEFGEDGHEIILRTKRKNESSKVDNLKKRGEFAMAVSGTNVPICQCNEVLDIIKTNVPDFKPCPLTSGVFGLDIYTLEVAHKKRGYKPKKSDLLTREGKPNEHRFEGYCRDFKKQEGVAENQFPRNLEKQKECIHKFFREEYQGGIIMLCSSCHAMFEISKRGKSPEELEKLKLNIIKRNGKLGCDFPGCIDPHWEFYEDHDPTRKHNQGLSSSSTKYYCGSHHTLITSICPTQVGGREEAIYEAIKKACKEGIELTELYVEG